MFMMEFRKKRKVTKRNFVFWTELMQHQKPAFRRSSCSVAAEHEGVKGEFQCVNE